MGSLFGGGSKMPAPVAPPPVPTNNDAAVNKAAEDDAIRRQGAGRTSTVLTGGQGLGSVGNVSSTAGLLGGS